MKAFTSQAFGQLSTSGRMINTYTLKNAKGVFFHFFFFCTNKQKHHTHTCIYKKGMEIEVLNYGATLRSLRVPGKAQVNRDVVIGVCVCMLCCFLFFVLFFRNMSKKKLKCENTRKQFKTKNKNKKQNKKRWIQ